MREGRRPREPHGDYRARATRGVALAALAFLLPFTLYALLRGSYVMVAGGVYITALLSANTWLVGRGIDHEPTTFFGLVPGGILFMGLAFGVDGHVASTWCFPSILACYCMLSGRKARIANGLILLVAIPMLWLTLAPVESARLTVNLLAVSLFASILVREIDAQQRRLKFQLEHDPLTGLLNRTSLKRRLQGALDAFRLARSPAAVLSLDLDHFKAINDRFGHDAGDLVLREVAGLFRREIGERGAVFRMGGEEFLILLHEHDEAAARRRAEALRATIARSVILQGCPVTVSIGVAALRAADDRESWTRRGDERLYRAKRGGRDRVVSSGSDGAVEAFEAKAPPLALALD